MRKIFIGLMSLTLAITAIAAMPTATKAASKGYKSVIKVVDVNTDAEEIIYSDKKSEIKTVEGFNYDSELNTIYINNVNMPDAIIKAENMGELRVIFWGENVLAGLESLGGKYSKEKVKASLLLSGAGSVTLGENEKVAHAISILANGTDSIYKCGKYLNMTALGNDGAAVVIEKSTNKKPYVYCTKGLEVDNDANNVTVNGAACKHTYTIMGEVISPSDQFTKGKANMICELCGSVKVKNIPRIAKSRLMSYGFRYDGKAKKPAVEIINENDKPISPKYYTVTYKDNVNKTTKYKMARVIIKFKGPYTGTITKYFAIG